MGRSGGGSSDMGRATMTSTRFGSSALAASARFCAIVVVDNTGFADGLRTIAVATAESPRNVRIPTMGASNNRPKPKPTPTLSDSITARGLEAASAKDGTRPSLLLSAFIEATGRARSNRPVAKKAQPSIAPGATPSKKRPPPTAANRLRAPKADRRRHVGPVGVAIMGAA